jgi:hypothetical protein
MSTSLCFLFFIVASIGSWLGGSAMLFIVHSPGRYWDGSIY